MVFEGATLSSSAFFNAREFKTITLREVAFNKEGTDPILDFKKGKLLDLDKVHFGTEGLSNPYIIEEVKDVKL